jgi:hypothetical protein
VIPHARRQEYNKNVSALDIHPDNVF